MRAAFLYGKEDLRFIEVPIPVIGEDEVLIQVKSAAICGTDVRMYLNGAKGIGEETPLILGHEMAGVIAETGKKVVHYKKGMRVAVAPNMGCGICDDCIRGRGHMCKDYRALGININGGFADYVRIPAGAVRSGNLVEMEDTVSFAKAAVTEALSCVYNGSRQCNIRPGDTVLVIGAGPIGLLHAMLAKMAGASKVYLNDISKTRLEACKKIDADFITISHDLKAFIEKEKGVDVVITACPVPTAQQDALELARNYGRVCFFGGLPEDKKMVPLNTNAIHYKQLCVTGTTRASLLQFKEALGFVSAGILQVGSLITGEYKLEEIQKGFDAACVGNGFKNVIHMQ